ncbi:hypothetical protein [Acinetobacter pittii]|uniref:hypothetical protein n=1 Tax=Acinetobacter pittii TaxID=48296 RepID=UPI001EEC37E5|nr:hypothetical protein [Acinetobacter pittii]
MSAYLILDVDLPDGPEYLDLSVMMLPESISSVGRIMAAYNFTSGLDAIAGEINSTVVGAPVETDEGFYLGNTGYIDTGLKETDEFLWIALARVSSGTIYTPLISNFVASTLSSSGFSLGNNVGKTTTAVKLANNADASGSFNAVNITVGNWALIALSKKIETGGYRYHYACKPAGAVLQQASSSLGTASKNTEQSICIGWTPKGGSLIQNATTLINFASIHSKGLSSSELGALMNSVVAELNQQGFGL